ncbi:hypothetical protein T261_8189 [Streptomyces lydicus]|nr:hypothetical protein T261_8189 [Streptomyces lydicus]
MARTHADTPPGLDEVPRLSGVVIMVFQAPSGREECRVGRGRC